VRYSPPFFGLAFGLALPDARRAVRDNLRMVRGPVPPLQELRQVAEVFTNFASSMTEAMLIGSDRGYRAINHPVDDCHYRQCYAQGRGVIMAAAQTSGWDIGGTVLGLAQADDVLVVMERENNATAAALHDLTRERQGVRLVHAGSDPLAPLALLKHLRRGGTVALKFDRVGHGMRTRETQLFGRRWAMPEGLFRLASVSGAPIVPAFTRRLGFLEYELRSYPAIALPRRPSEQQLDAATKTLAGHLEGFVRSHPTHWLRFSAPAQTTPATRPPSAAPPPPVEAAVDGP